MTWSRKEHTAGDNVTEEIRVIFTGSDRHVIGIRAGNDKENVSTVVVRVPEETLQRMERNAENVEEITIYKKCAQAGRTVCICSKGSPTQTLKFNRFQMNF